MHIRAAICTFALQIQKIERDCEAKVISPAAALGQLHHISNNFQQVIRGCNGQSTPAEMLAVQFTLAKFVTAQTSVLAKTPLGIATEQLQKLIHTKV